ncbi:MAG: translation initiation factor IF-2 subunit gamma [archaeon]
MVEKKIAKPKAEKAHKAVVPAKPHAEKVHAEKAHPSVDHKSTEHKTVEHKAEAKATHAKEAHAKKNEVAQPQINVGMIGHVDHGKTSLTKALTGKWCDTHSEEVKRGISIRLGYADVTFYKFKTPSRTFYSNHKEEGLEPISQRTVSFVDAPGHETLMTTMLSGAALMNGAVLVIAANEVCPQPRTIEHLMALKFAGVDKIVVAQNKIDLLEKDALMKHYASIKKFLTDYGYADAPIIPVSANFGANLDLLIEAIETHITTPEFDTKKPLKMFVARSFDINKPGTKINDMKGAILGGSISQGMIHVGDEIELYPGLNGKMKTKVMSISTSNGIISEARPGGLMAIATTLDPSTAQNDQYRGQIIAAVGTLPEPVKEVKIALHLFERVLDAQMKELTTIKVSDAVVVTVGTNTVVGFVLKTDGKIATLNLKTLVIVEKGEKIALSKNINGQWRLVAYAEVM